jgi:hypothetical protein
LHKHRSNCLYAEQICYGLGGFCGVFSTGYFCPACLSRLSLSVEVGFFSSSGHPPCLFVQFLPEKLSGEKDKRRDKGLTSQAKTSAPNLVTLWSHLIRNSEGNKEHKRQNFLNLRVKQEH